MSSDNSEGYAVVGFFFGLFMFYKGFRQFRNYLLLADTPEIAIRSIPMGFAEIHGKAEGEKTLVSPISQTPCFVYKVVIERWNSDSGNDDGYWVPHQIDWDGVGFYLTDATGKVLVDAQGAELDIPETASCEAGKGASPSTGVTATQQELLEYVKRAESHWAGGMFEHGLRYVGQQVGSASEQRHLNLKDVFQHPPGTPEFLRGAMTVMGPRMKRHLESMGPQADPKREEARQTMLQALQHPPGSKEYMEGVRRAEQMAGKPGATPTFNALTKALRQDPAQSDVASGRYSFTEYCLVPGGQYDISGTCIENPHPKDANDHNLMARGTNEKQFLISSTAEKPLKTGLRMRAIHMILVGAGMAIACMAILLFDLGLL
ncbi:MAG: hypothetical protein P8Z30_15915 [Acidobacteriota bacterium]